MQTWESLILVKAAVKSRKLQITKILNGDTNSTQGYVHIFDIYIV